VKRSSKTAIRFREPLRALLADVLPSSGLVLELGSGTGEHCLHFAAAFPQLTWQPSDPDPEARESISAWSREAALPNLLAPLNLDLLSPSWTLRHADALLCVNVLHLAGLNALGQLMSGATKVLPLGGQLIVAGFFEAEAVHPNAKELVAAAELVGLVELRSATLPDQASASVFTRR
jgi:hypothetical protein